MIATKSPSLFTSSSEIDSLQIQAGDKVKDGQVLASIYGHELTNKFSQECSTYDQLTIEVGRHLI